VLDYVDSENVGVQITFDPKYDEEFKALFISKPHAKTCYEELKDLGVDVELNKFGNSDLWEIV
jgi:hypothetical protein